MPREEIGGMLDESRRSLDAEHGALRAEVESGLKKIGAERPPAGA